VERARWRTTASYRVLHFAQIGVEYNPEVAEVTPIATVFLLTETDRRPALFLGTSADRIGSPEGTQSYYITASKLAPWVPVSAYATINYSEWDDGINFPFGAEWFVHEGFSVRGMYDGHKPHAMVSWFGDRFGVSLIAVWLDTFGISIAGGI
jgi:hypothetical protein